MTDTRVALVRAEREDRASDPRASSDRAYVLNRGEIVFDGSAAELGSSDVFERYLSTT